MVKETMQGVGIQKNKFTLHSMLNHPIGIGINKL